MDNIGLLIAFMLISPGFCLAYAVRTGSRYDIKIDTQNNTSQLIFLIIISACVQVFIVPAYIYVIQYHFNDLQLLKSFFSLKTYLANSKTYSFSYKHWWEITLYLPFSYIISWLFGYMLISLIEREYIRTDILHGAMYSLISGKLRPLIYCSVVTKFQHENCILMYKGRLKSVSYVSKHTIEQLMLDAPERFLMTVDSKNQTILTTPKSRVSYFPTDMLPEILTLQGENIENVLFTKYFPLDGQDDWLFKAVLLLLPIIIFSLYPPLISMVWNPLYSFLEQAAYARN